MPLDLRLGKMLIYSSLFGCVEPVLTVAAAMGGKSPFARPPQADENEVFNKHNAFGCRPGTGAGAARGVEDASSSFFSDHLSIVAAYNQWEEICSARGQQAGRVFCQEHFLSSSVLWEMQQLRQMFRGYLVTAGYIHLIS